MEVKILLRLINDDIAHLEGITGDFSVDSLPSPDEVELALVRAKTLLRELELLNKITAQHENNFAAIKFVSDPKVDLPDHIQLEQEPFEMSARENVCDEHKDILTSVHHDLIPAVVVLDSELNIEDQQKTEESHEIPINVITAEEHFSALVEPAELSDLTEVSPVIAEEEGDDQLNVFVEPAGSDDFVPISPVENEEEVIDLTTFAAEPSEILIDTPKEPAEIKEEVTADTEVQNTEISAIVESVTTPDLNEEILAEKFSEAKKTLNETLSDQHQMVNDILSTEKGETGYKITSINSIWDGIGINDRFLFIRELFANSSAKLENTVNALDKMATIQAAVSYLKMNFKWNKTEASQKFLVLVKRRFTK